MGTHIRVLLVEDSENDALLLVRELTRGGYEVTHQRVDTRAQLAAALDAHAWDLVIGDYSMPHFSGTEALAVLREKELSVPFIFVSGTIGEEIAVAAMRTGASDYITKANLVRLVPAVGRELREAESRRQRKQLEDQLRQAQKMEAIGRLTGGIAHDFNNLLNVIMGYSELLLLRMRANDPLRQSALEIKEAGMRAASLTRQLLAFSRQQVLEPRVLNLNRVVRDVEKLLGRLIGEDIILRAVLEPQLKSVRVDPSQVEQVILNLAINSRDAMPEGGELTIETANVELDAEFVRRHAGAQAGRHVMLAVSDTGHGMDSQTQTQVFEPFFTTKDKEKGTGLGLATVYGIVKQSGGSIWLYSELGKGTTFKIYLPAVEEQEDRVAPVKPSSTAGTETVLVVEDSEPLRRLTRALLESKGYAVILAGNAAEAQAAAEKHPGPIHLLLTDVVLPGASGRSLADALVAMRPDMRVLFMSGYTDNAVLHRGVLSSGSAFLQKPFTLESLALKVREVLER